MFTPTPDHEELRRTVRRFFDVCTPESVVRETMAGPDGLDRALWSRMATELGLLGLAVPEEHGGSGFGFAESCLVLEEAGRALVCAPLLSTLGLAVNTLLLAADEPSCKQLLPGVVDGESRVAVALPDQTYGLSESRTGETAVLTGTVRAVLDGAASDTVLLLVRGNLYAVETSRVRAVPRQTLDLTRRSADLALTGVTARHVGTVPDVLATRLRDLAVVALAAEQLGGAQRALDATVEYAKLRVQFGRTIGSFQAVKHRLADMLVTVETARSAAYAALGAAVCGDARALALAAGIAGAYCSEAYAQVAEEAIQVHGGIGFTWEHPAHLWFRRAKADAVLFGTPAAHRARVAELIP